MLNKLILISVVLLTACAPAQGDPCGTVTDVYGNRIIQKTLPVVFSIQDTVKIEHLQEIEQAVSEINASIGKTLIVTKINESSENSISFPDPWPYGKTEIGMTVFKRDYTFGIKEADIYIDTKNHSFTDKGFDLRTLMLHEFLHALGFNHVDNPNDILYSYVKSGEKKYINPEAVERIRCVYGKTKNVF